MWVAVYLIACFVVAGAGVGRKIGYWGTFLVCLFLSPIVGLIVALIVPNADKKPIQNQTSVNSKSWKQYYEDGQRFEFKERYAEALDAYQDSLFELKKINKKLSKEQERYKDMKHSELEVLIDDMKKRLAN